MDEHPELAALRRKLEEEESAYAAALAAVDALARLPEARQAEPELLALRQRLNELWDRAAPPQGRSPAAAARRRIWQTMVPALDRQRDFNSVLVQILNATFEDDARLRGHLRSLCSMLVQYLQRLQPMVDARDRVASALSTLRAELTLESFDRRQESVGRRLEGLLAMRDRLETVSEQVAALRDSLDRRAPTPPAAAAASQAAEDALYAAFENRFRGSREELREHLRFYLDLFREQAPVVDLGCGRGEFLELLRDIGVDARGVELNARFARECQAKGLTVEHGDLLAYLRGAGSASLGGVFAAQVAEHLPPAVLLETLRECHRALRPGGVMVLETVNPRTVAGLLEVFHRDLTHQKPLHPETLAFLAAAQGFSEVRVELRAPVEADSVLREVPPDGLPPLAVGVLNENVRRLNALLYGPQEYALIARR